VDTRDPPVPASTVSHRFSGVAGFYRTCVLDAILEHTPVEHVRRPAVPAESPTLGFTRLQFETLLTAPRESPSRYDFALVAMLGLLGLRIFEATGADIADLGEEHGHRLLRVGVPAACTSSPRRLASGLPGRTRTCFAIFAVTTMLDVGVDLRDVQSPPVTPTRAPLCATTELARTWTATPTTSSRPTWPPAPNPDCVSRT
jgi:integrase/recombinase XerD